MRGSQRPFRVSNSAGSAQSQPPLAASPASRDADLQGRPTPGAQARLSSPAEKGGGSRLGAPPRGPSLPRAGPSPAPLHPCSSANRGLALPLTIFSVPSLPRAKSLRQARDIWPRAKSVPLRPPPETKNGWGAGERIFHMSCDSYMKSNFGAHKGSFVGTQPCSLFMCCLWLLSCCRSGAGRVPCCMTSIAWPTKRRISVWPFTEGVPTPTLNPYPGPLL